MEKTIIQIDENTWRIEDGHVRFFLLEGDNEALMIDSGVASPDAREIGETITDKPLKLLNTHADPDHISGNDAFAEFYMSPDEWDNFHNRHGRAGRVIPVHEGDVIDLGNRELRIIDLPGHTPGSIAVLDAEKKMLFSGNPIQNGRIFMFGEHRNMPKYIESLESLMEKHSEEFELICPSHGDIPQKKDLVPALISAAKKILAGNMAGQETEMFGRKIVYYDAGCAGFLCDR